MLGVSMGLTRLAAAAAFVAVCASPAAARADVEAMRELTTELVQRAVAHFEAVGFEQARADFNDPTDRRWLRSPYHQHVFAMDGEGVVWADNVFHGLIGLNFQDIVDADGYAFGRDILENASGDGSVFGVEIRFMHPNGALVRGYGACSRPDRDAVICAWAEETPS